MKTETVDFSPHAPPRVLSYDPDSGVRQLYYYDPATDTMGLQTIQDAEPVLAANQALRAQTDERARWGEGQRVAQIPLVVFYDLVKKGITRDRKAFKKWLNDPINEPFRTRRGIV